MGAVEIVPDPTRIVSPFSLPRLLAGDRGVAAAILSAASPARSSTGAARAELQLASALDNMTQGLCMFDGAARLIICNERYLEMYGLTREHAYPGCPLRDLLEIPHGDRLVLPGRRRIRRRRQAARDRGQGVQQHRRGARPHHLDLEPADRRRRLGLHPRGHHRAAPRRPGARPHGGAGAAPRRRRRGDRGVPSARRDHAEDGRRARDGDALDRGGAVCGIEQDLAARRRRGRHLQRSVGQRRDRRRRRRGAVGFDRARSAASSARPTAWSAPR